MKYLYILILLILSLISFDNNIDKNEDWMSIYENYIYDNIDTTVYITISTCYVDDDSIPELCLFGTCYFEGSIILSQYAGTVTQHQCYWSPHYIERSGLIDDGYAKYGHYGDHILELNKGVFTEILHTEAVWHDANPPYFVYTINGQVIETLYGEDANEESCQKLIDTVNQVYHSKGTSLLMYNSLP